MEKKPFLDLYIGDLFTAHNLLWVKTSGEAATTVPRSRMGVCNFTQDECDKYVTPVDTENVEQFVLKAAI